MDDSTLLVLLDQVVRDMPSIERMYDDDPDTMDWLGRAAALVDEWSPPHSIRFISAADDLHENGRQYQAAVRVSALLRQARSAVQMRFIGPESVSVPQGGVFDFFDQVRKFMERAKLDLFIVDPYLDPEFASRYLPMVPSGTKVRLLTNKHVQALREAVDLFAKQHRTDIEVRSAGNLHDRYLFIDRTECILSTQSLKDGAKKQPAALVQVIDLAPQTLKMYEDIWASATLR